MHALKKSWRISNKISKMSVNIIHILGASGSGTTTLGRALSEEYGCTHLDSDDFFWEPTDPPFTVKRERALRQSMLSSAVDEAEKCVISGSMCGWGDILIERLDLVIYVYTPAEIRKERLESREFERFGDRILQGGDMYDEHLKFIEWAMQYDIGGLDMRSAKMHEQWLSNLTCPVMKISGTDTCAYNLSLIDGYIRNF